LAETSSFYKSFDFALLKENREPSEQEKTDVAQNWDYLKEQNVSKANYLCKGIYEMPTSKSDIHQDKIFAAQLKDYVNTKECKVSVLNAFPLFFV